ncbi:hypothetical protein GON03_07725 [Nocardioides sp. MAH-18]|uniref:Uncharacterized protein n=1 Tax=Nocardioides agri TaxID=2682843 RepID=A0A6L6XPY8_9ACTN|nr:MULTISPECIES: hypothetical protein [unclassified Nocardioides]MBA2954206.1 hypothetical protein [Nocardioides sp. CGMCC 1.13656]MVQ49068.1 hypothetical protein [Nocardioides sp. MAH-18]
MTVTLARTRRSVVVALVAGAVLVAGLAFWRASGDDATAPYDDPESAGLLTLCAADGTPVTGGRVDERPFVDVVLGETGLPPAYDARGAVATLFAYQPREGVAASEFSGSPLTAAAVLADATKPGAVVTEDAWSLGDFTTAFPADWDGYVQLRLYLGTPDAGTLTDQPYDTADLRVDGDRWELVRGGGASCADAESVTVP